TVQRSCSAISKKNDRMGQGKKANLTHVFERHIGESYTTSHLAIGSRNSGMCHRTHRDRIQPKSCRSPSTNVDRQCTSAKHALRTSDDNRPISDALEEFAR